MDKMDRRYGVKRIEYCVHAIHFQYCKVGGDIFYIYTKYPIILLEWG